MTADIATSLRPLIDRVRTDITAVKTDGGSRWTTQPLTDARLTAHLTGGLPRGVCPIREGESTTCVGLLDLDSHRGTTPWSEMCILAGKLADYMQVSCGWHPVLFRSSGGHGIHIYVLWGAPQDAYSVRMALTDVVSACGLRNGAKGVSAGQVEVFPKQNDVKVGGNGNQFILPYAGKSEPLAYEELSGGYELQGHVPVNWDMSPPVAVKERPVVSTQQPVVSTQQQTWRMALDALSNTGESELDYDDWFRVVSAIHHETEGSAEGFGLALAWSARSAKHAAGGDFFELRVWPYLNSDGRRANGGGTIESLAAKLHGWHRPIEPFGAIDDPDLGSDPDADSRLVARSQAPGPLRDAVSVATAALASIPLDSAADTGRGHQERRGVPTAKHLTTDLANANRLVAAYGASVLVVGGKWHVWTGKVWRADEADIYRFASKLSALIKAEAKELRAKAAGATAFGEGGNERASKVADALEKWSAKSEMKGAIEAAIGLARKMLTVDASVMDSNPWLLNCRNGVVDLRTGSLLPHSAGLFMTKIVDVDYKPDADCGLWERTVLEITRETGLASPPVANFLQRWFGYCTTADVREQVFVVHWGDGANGKSTVLDVVSRVLGAYAGVAAPGLIASNSKVGHERHPTELADLRGLRMVVAHESRDGAALTEDTVKAITGGDIVKARYMREDFFQFLPTHKVQLLTNSKPTVKGTDHGIWRRVHLVAYGARFGSAEDVTAGRATAIKDKTLVERLTSTDALEGVLAWLVRGAVMWFTDGGLRPPAAVIEASEEYRRSQDRVAHFIEECCEVGSHFEEPMMVGSLGLYPTYVLWCKEAGVFPLSRARFVTELERTVPGLVFRDVHRKTSSGARRKVKMVIGLHVPEA